jgi:hypothetical protein
VLARLEGVAGVAAPAALLDDGATVVAGDAVEGVALVGVGLVVVGAREVDVGAEDVGAGTWPAAAAASAVVAPGAELAASHPLTPTMAAALAAPATRRARRAGWRRGCLGRGSMAVDYGAGSCEKPGNRLGIPADLVSQQAHRIG